MARLSKRLIEAYYGRLPERSYYVGCSEGGREGMMVAQRFPQLFDGILACAPGLHLPQAALAAVSDAQAFAAVAREAKLTDANGRPHLNRTFTDEDLLLVNDAILAACDRLDGLADGIVDGFTACTTSLVAPKLDTVTCMGLKTTSCLSVAQVNAVKKVHEAAMTADGRRIYSSRAWDAGVGGKVGTMYNQGWRIWKIGAFDSQMNTALNVTLAPLSLAAIFMTPPIPLATTGGNQVAFGLSLDLRRALDALAASSPLFADSSLSFMKADETNLSEFRAHGGKLIVVHGVSDPAFSIVDIIDWWNQVNAFTTGRAAEFVRLFAVPGMNHCVGGPATDQFNAFAALVDWVEKGLAPQRIIATARASTPWPGRTRPLCPYPTQARYVGAGSIEDASNFVCK